MYLQKSKYVAGGGGEIQCYLYYAVGRARGLEWAGPSWARSGWVRLGQAVISLNKSVSTRL